MVSNSFMMKCTIIQAVSSVCKIKVSVTMFCAFNITSVARGAQSGLIPAEVPLCFALHKHQLEQRRADESRRANANKSPGWFLFWPAQFCCGSGVYMPCWHNACEWDVVAGDTFAEVTTAASWLESPTAEEPPQLIFGVSAPLVPWGEERRPCVCIALTHSAPVYAACVFFPHYS